jgi:anti-sigma-K factor RskA
MKDSLHIADTDLTLYALGALPAAEMNSLRAHFLFCAQCKEELRQETLALAAYAATTPEGSPPEGARDRFLAKLGSPAEQRAADTANKRSRYYIWRKSTMVWFQAGRWAAPLAAALATLLLLVSIDDLRRRSQFGPLMAEAQHGAIDSAKLNELMELLTTANAQKVVLREIPVVAPPPEGHVVYAPHSGRLLLTASNLRPLAPGKTYELWILQADGKKPVPAGTFVPDISGNAALILPAVAPNLAVQGFGVTVENAGGSDTPTMPIVLSGH